MLEANRIEKLISYNSSHILYEQIRDEFEIELAENNQEYRYRCITKFENEIWSKLPHIEENKVVNPTPLTDLTDVLKECSKTIYKLDISDLNLKVFGKFDADV